MRENLEYFSYFFILKEKVKIKFGESIVENNNSKLM